MDASALDLRPVDPAAVPCKVCGGGAALFGVQDFNRSCEEAKGKFLPLAGIPIYYRRCDRCGLIFTDAFDDWSDEAFAAHIYNDRYIEVDPDFETLRPNNNAHRMVQMLKGHEARLKILDYGGGNGRFAQVMADADFLPPATYDRFHPAHRSRPAGQFDVVTCFETLEHMPDPKSGAADIVSFVAEGGLLMLSTLVQPKTILNDRLHWWYAGPRNGHVTLFSYQALARLFGELGFQVYPTSSPAYHLVCRDVPDFMKTFMSGGRPVPVGGTDAAA